MRAPSPTPSQTLHRSRTCTGDGCVYLFDLARQQEVVRPVLTLDANGMRKPVYSLAFNPRKPDLLATGDPTGIQVRAVLAVVAVAVVAVVGSRRSKCLARYSGCVGALLHAYS